MKKFVGVALMFVLLVVPRFVFAVNSVDIDQSGVHNEATATQVGSNLSIDVDQTAGGNNSVEITQGGTGGTVGINQTANTAGKNNTAEVSQKAGTNHSVNIIQTSTTQGNSADIDQADAADTAIGKVIIVEQSAKQSNCLDIDQIDAGDGTRAEIYQSSTTSHNDADLTQKGNSQFIGTQTAPGYNHLDVTLDVAGDASANTAFLSQEAPVGFNDAYIVIDAGGVGTYNILGRADTFGNIDPTAAAIQVSSGAYNTFSWTATGGNNQVGLYQEGTGPNLADINQYGSNNSLSAYQVTGGGSNSLFVEQGGESSAVVIQNSATGNNSACIYQQ